MKELVRELLGEELAGYLELLRAKAAFAEKLYGVKMNYIPLITEGDAVVLDRRDGLIKWLKTKEPLEEDELRELADKIRENLESGYVEMLLALNMPYIRRPGE